MQRIILNRTICIIIGAVIGASLVYVGCGGGGGGGTSLNTSLTIPAGNIVFRNTQNNATAKSKLPSPSNMLGDLMVPSAHAQDTYMDETTQILAENVILETGTNSLESDNLQDALDNEIAVDIPSALSGKTWHVENRSGSDWLNNSEGQITFTSSSEFTLDSGKMAATDMMDEPSARSTEYWDLRYTESATVEYISNNLLFVTWLRIGYNGNTDGTARAIIQVVPVNQNKIILIGSGPVTGHSGLSTLTLAE